MTGEQLIPASQQDTWRALQDPDVIKDCVPGCDSIARVNDNEYQVQMTARVAYTSNHSVGVSVLMTHGHALSGELRPSLEAYMTFVPVDRRGAGPGRRGAGVHRGHARPVP